MNIMDRRQFIGQGIAAAGLFAGFSRRASASVKKAEILVIGGGYGGATAAKYLRLFSDNTANVTLIDPSASFISCPLSNLVVGGSRTLADITIPYSNLRQRHGIQIIQEKATKIDADRKQVQLGNGKILSYDKLVLSPGISMLNDSIEGLSQANQQGITLQAWKAGPETVALYQQLKAMRDGGTFVISIPEAPFRCPSAPYERACQVANYLKHHKPRSKVIVLDANQDVLTKAALFKKVWAEQYADMIEYLPQHNVVAVDAKTKTVKFEIQDDIHGDVLNLLPSMSAGVIAVKTGLANSNGRWVNVQFLNFESTAQKNIHVLGDSIQVANAMPKSGHMANQQAKVAAAAIIAELNDWEINPSPVLTNACYSFVNATDVIHVDSVHQYIAAEKTFKPVPGSGGVSPGPNALEGTYAWGWAHNIWADSLG